MKVTLIWIGRTEPMYLEEGIRQYVHRLTRYLPFDIIEIPDLKRTASLSEPIFREKEGLLILKKIPEGAVVVLLDEHGKRYTSKGFAALLQSWMNQGTRQLCFIIGGAYGFSETVKQKAMYQISLSDMTFSHQMVRLFFTEQVYRAMTILKNEPYHNE